MKEIVQKHSFLTRWCHWIHFPILAGMVWSGILIYWANDIYFPIPSAMARALGIDHRLALGMGWHFFLAWIFAVNGAVFFAWLVISGEWRELWPGRGSLRDAWGVVLHDLGVRRALPAQGKFNAAQRIAYSGVILLGAGSLLTGLAIYKPVQLSWITQALGGYEPARFLHFLFTLGIVFFFLVHLAQVVKAGWNGFQAMVTGYEVEKN